MLGKGSSVWPDSPPRAWGGSYAQRPPLPSSIGASIGSPGGADSGGETKAVCPCRGTIETARARPSGWGQRSRRGHLPAPLSPSEGGFPAWSVPVLPRPAPPGSPSPSAGAVVVGGGVLARPSRRAGRSLAAWIAKPLWCGLGVASLVVGEAGAAQPVILNKPLGRGGLGRPCPAGAVPPALWRGLPPSVVDGWFRRAAPGRPAPSGRASGLRRGAGAAGSTPGVTRQG